MLSGLKKLIYGKKWAQPIFGRMHRLALSGMNIGSGGDLSDDGEKFVLSYLKKKISETQKLTLFDVGANIGDYSKQLRESFGIAGEIFSFEPASKTYQKLLERFKKEEGLHLYQMGLGSKQGQMTLYTDKELSGLASIYKRRLDHFDISFNEAENVPVSTIDIFCEEHTIKNIDLLKLDVEGHELAILTGANRMIQSNAIKFIQFEFGGANIDSRTFFQDFYYLLHERYRLYRILRDGLQPIDHYAESNEIFMYSNFLAELKSASH